MPYNNINIIKTYSLKKNNNNNYSFQEKIIKK